MVVLAIAAPVKTIDTPDRESPPGDNRTAAIIAPDHALNAAGIARIQGLAALLPVGATSFSGGNIILGGAGSDILEGRGGDDILDGDAWLDAQIRVTGVRPPGVAEFHDTMATLNTVVIAGQINPGQLVIVRSIKVAAVNPAHIDTAVFSGPLADYDIVNNAGIITVTHARGTTADGTDTLRNIEALQFADRTISFVLRTVASGDVATANGAAPVNINVLANDTFDGLAIPAGAIVTRVTNAVDGNAVLNPDNTFTFTANAGFIGVATFTYNVTVSGQLSNTATVTVTVNPAVPVANNDVATTTGTTPVNINVLANDTYDGLAIPAGATVTRVTNSANGNAVLNVDNTFTFTANAGFSGIATFTYNVTVSGQVSNIATVSVTVISSNVIANNDVATTTGTTPVNINVLANDTFNGGAIPAGATVTRVTNSANGNAVLNADNTFTFTANAGFSGIATFTYTVTVLGQISNTATVSVTVNPAISSISGRVARSNGVAVPNVTMTLSGAATGTVTTDVNGNYTFAGLLNGNYTVTPSLAGFAFTPASRAVTINNVNVTGQDFTALPAIFSISGTVRVPGGGLGGGTPVAGVPVALTGAATANAITNALGVYTFTSLADGNYTVTPSQPGFVFTPVNRAVVINSANVTGRDFLRTVAAGTFSVSGTVTSGGLPLSGVSIALTGAATANTTTNASGVYTFTGRANGNYTVTPSLAGFTFAPVNRAVVINNANVTGQDFVGTAAAATFSISCRHGCCSHLLDLRNSENVK
ncbi:MAG: carboxypeptidase regulatory-like domain-containing protein [Nitrospirae bacterium]|nr:carboxypeptidase regulatory-like domain-containing protein [Nitrospirota bacterium]